MTGEPQPLDAATEAEEALKGRLGRKRGRRLHSLTNVKAALADTIRLLEADQISSDKARALGFLLRAMAEIIQKSDFEGRISNLESRIK